MRVQCPRCAASYEVPAIERPRRLRCAACREEWRVAPEPLCPPPPPLPPPEPPATVEAAVVAAAEPEPVPPPVAEAPAPADRLLPVPAAAGGRGAAGLWSALWLASLLLVGTAAAGTWHWRGAVQAGWPPSQRVFRLLPG